MFLLFQYKVKFKEAVHLNLDSLFKFNQHDKITDGWTNSCFINIDPIYVS